VRGSLKCLVNCFHHIIGFEQNVVVPESQHPISGCFQITGTFGVIWSLLLMLTAINLNYKSRTISHYSKALSPSKASRKRFLIATPSRNRGSTMGTRSVVTLIEANTGPGWR
jgi:hypothetical protein